MKIFICGPPDSGKTCLYLDLSEELLNVKGVPPLVLVKANPDGDDTKYRSLLIADQALADNYQTSTMGWYTTKFMETIIDWIGANFPFMLIDAGGKISPENEIICSYATHAIIVARNEGQMVEWRALCARHNVPVLAEIISDYGTLADRVPEMGEDGVWRGLAHRLTKKGYRDDGRPTVRRLAEISVSLLHK